MRNPVFETELSLFFRGGRDYIYAADIYALSTQAIFTRFEVDEIRNVDFSVHKMTDKGLTLMVYKGPFEIKGYCAKFSFMVKNESFYGVVIENDTKVIGSVPYDEQYITNKSSIGFDDKSVEINEPLDIPFLDVCTAMNKYMHENVFSDIRAKWVSVRIQLDVFRVLEPYQKICVQNRKVFGRKYTKNSIFMDGKKRGFIYFSIV